MIGKVRGRADVPYSTTAKLVRKAGGWSCTVGVCSCPVRKDCKHVAALLFAAEDNPAIRVQLLAPAEIQPADPAGAGAGGAGLGTGPQPAHRPARHHPVHHGIPLALQFESKNPPRISPTRAAAIRCAASGSSRRRP